MGFSRIEVKKRILYITKKKLYSLKNLYNFPFIAFSFDTVIIIGKKSIGKPTSYNEAKQIIKLFSGKWYEVLSGICIWISDENGFREIVDIEKSKVLFRKLSVDEISRYLISYNWRDKAGGYAIQDAGKNFAKEIKGSLSNIVGLPLSSIYKLLPMRIWRKII